MAWMWLMLSDSSMVMVQQLNLKLVMDHKQGGTYCCVCCGAESGHFSGIAYSYRSPKPSLKERQEFVLQGKAWKKGG